VAEQSPRRRVLTEDEWRRIATPVDLPEEARPVVEHAIARYHELSLDRATWQRPSVTRKNLASLAKSTTKFADLIAKLGEEERLSLGGEIGGWNSDVLKVANVRLQALHAALSDLAQHARAASKQREKLTAYAKPVDALGACPCNGWAGLFLKQLAGFASVRHGLTLLHLQV
jgi:hypothetical protein